MSRSLECAGIAEEAVAALQILLRPKRLAVSVWVTGAGQEPSRAVADVIERTAMMDAIEEQLGLKLVLDRGPIAVRVIDSVGRPSEN
jgi:uncharacterized protein (TIGR03435 family)